MIWTLAVLACMAATLGVAWLVVSETFPGRYSLRRTLPLILVAVVAFAALGTLVSNRPTHEVTIKHVTIP